MIKCLQCGKELVYKASPPIPLTMDDGNMFSMPMLMPGWFECRNGHREGYYNTIGRSMVEITPLPFWKGFWYTITHLFERKLDAKSRTQSGQGRQGSD
jgi:hypothetical protein